MRKKVNVIVILLLAVCLLTLVACQRDEDGLKKIKAPQNLALSGSALSWDEVERAERYIIYVGDEEKAETTSTTYDLSALVTGYGDFNITVRACGDGVKYGKSDRSEVIVYHKGNSLDVPQVKVDNGAKLAKWQTVPNAVEYAVSVYNGKDEVLINQEITTQTEFSFVGRTNDEGNDIFEGFDKYRITVTAKPAKDSSEYSDSLLGSDYYINSTTLTVPEFSSLNASRIQWNSIANATSYELKLIYRSASDGSTVEKKTVSTTGTSYQRSNFNYDEVGDYYFTIRAIGDNEIYYDSVWSEEKEDYKVTKLSGVEEGDIELKYDADGKARLTWSIDANTSANQFYLSLKGLKPDGKSEKENSDTSLTVSSKVNYVTYKTYDVYEYTDAAQKTTVRKVDGVMYVYNMNDDLKVRYNGEDYFVSYNDEDAKMSYTSYTDRRKDNEYIDIILVEGDTVKFEFRQGVKLEDESRVNQDTGAEEQELLDNEGKPMYYFEEGNSDSNVEKTVIFDAQNKPEKLVFAINLDSIFIKEVEEKIDPEDEESATKTTYEYLIKDPSYYGILYNITVSAGNSSSNYVASSDAVTDGRYLSYKIPETKHDNALNSDYYEITSVGEYAYIILKNYIDNNEGETIARDYRIAKNLNFDGYEVPQIETLKDTIYGYRFTLSNMVVGNSQLTENGVVESDRAEKVYSLYYEIAQDAKIDGAFYMGIDFVGYAKEDFEDSDVEDIFVAPIAYENKGTLSEVFVQSDAIEADSANLAGMVILNSGAISNSQVYANLSGRQVAGMVITNQATINGSGFYGSIDAKVGEYIKSEDLEYVAGAGLVVNNKNHANITDSEAIGSINVEASNLDAVYAGGLVAINDGNITSSFSGEYHGVNVAKRTEVFANGKNSYAGGFVALNDTNGLIENSYATNRAKASEYAGGFVGLNKGSITTAYAVGGTERGGSNYGVFAGENEGSISNVAAYSSDSWAKTSANATDYLSDSFIDNLDNLGDIVSMLYPDESNRYMTYKEDIDGFRYPILVNKTYTKDYVVEMRPTEIPEVNALVVVGGNLKEIKLPLAKGDDVSDDEYTEYINNMIRGNRSRNNKVVIVIADELGNHTKLVYGKIK